MSNVLRRLAIMALPLGAPATNAMLQVRPAAQSTPTSIAQEAIDEDGDGTVCDARFFPAGQVQDVIASVDASGRRFCNGVLLIRGSASPKIAQTIQAWMVEDLSHIVADLDQDGVMELLIPTATSAYEGAQCTAVIPVVYTRCASGEYCVRDNDTSISFYYQEGIEYARRAALATVDEFPCAAMARDKLLRLARMDSTAGFQQAVEWMASENPSLRRKAVAVFSDIGDEPSRERLRRLATDPDRQVAARAVRALSR